MLGAAATLGSIGPAQAALYTGTWDPNYGGIFPNLGWRVEGNFDVPDACLALGTGSNIGISGPCAGFDVIDTTVSFYDIASPTTILESFSLDPNVVVNGISLLNGDFAGIDSGFYNFFVPTLSIAGGGAYSFSLIFYGGIYAQLIYAQPITTSPTCANPFTPVQGAMCGVSANPAVGVFAPVGPVPEPETYALMVAGLGALGFVARRRRRQAS